MCLNINEAEVSDLTLLEDHLDTCCRLHQSFGIPGSVGSSGGKPVNQRVDRHDQSLNVMIDAGYVP